MYIVINNLIFSNELLNFPTCKGLKTGMYYLRTRAAADAIKFTVDISSLNNVNYFVAFITLQEVHDLECTHH